MLELGRLDGERPDPVLDVTAQCVFVHITACRQGEIHGIGAQPHLAQCLRPQRPELAPALDCDRIDGTRGQRGAADGRTWARAWPGRPARTDASDSHSLVKHDYSNMTMADRPKSMRL